MADEQEMRSEAERLLSSAQLPAEGSLTQGISVMHEVYLSLKESGFSEFQALWIIGYIITGGQKPSEES
jgi:hypothetical protein